MTNATLSQPIARQQAAAALREAHQRLMRALDGAEACGWALAMLPESRAAQRLMLDWLLRSRQFEEVITRTGAALLHADAAGDWRLLVRRAEALLNLQRTGEALDAIDRALASRPHHRRGLLLKATIHAHAGDHAAALQVLELADAHHPRHADVAPRLIESLLANDRADDAAAVLDQMHDAAPEWQARTLAAQGRLLDARIVLEDAIHWELDEARRDHLRLMHIDMLEQAGDWPALRALALGAAAADADAGGEGNISPLLAQRLAEAALPMGVTSDAVSPGLCPGVAPTTQRLHVAAALAAARGANVQAIALLTGPRPASNDSNNDDAGAGAGARAGAAARTFEPWLRALLGSIASEQIEPRHARRAGADPSLSVLDALLPAAMEAFDAAIEHHPDSSQELVWQTMRSDCQAARDRDRREEHHRADAQPEANAASTQLRRAA